MTLSILFALSRSARQVTSSPGGPVPSGIGVWLRATCLAATRAPLHPQRHAGDLSQIRYRSAGSPFARRRYVFFQAMGCGESGAVGHPRHDEGGEPVSRRILRRLGITAGTTSMCAMRCMARGGGGHSAAGLENHAGAGDGAREQQDRAGR